MRVFTLAGRRCGIKLLPVLPCSLVERDGGTNFTLTARFIPTRSENKKPAEDYLKHRVGGAGDGGGGVAGWS